MASYSVLCIDHLPFSCDDQSPLSASSGRHRVTAGCRHLRLPCRRGNGMHSLLLIVVRSFECLVWNTACVGGDSLGTSRRQIALCTSGLARKCVRADPSEHRNIIILQQHGSHLSSLSGQPIEISVIMPASLIALRINCYFLNTLFGRQGDNTNSLLSSQQNDRTSHRTSGLTQSPPSHVYKMGPSAFQTQNPPTFSTTPQL